MSGVEEKEPVGVRRGVFPEHPIGDGRHHAQKCGVSDEALTAGESDGFFAKITVAEPLQGIPPDAVVVEPRANP
jgi:hypothetical protein